VSEADIKGNLRSDKLLFWIRLCAQDGGVL
jgi:hypothetical protein